ncbi:MAG: lysophospholipid acyltransferase family protein [Gammaproteobacteria bacterium]|nr:lysophospholipid acyltransferase family protein [Gammaproteobacteria bacterium]
MGFGDFRYLGVLLWNVSPFADNNRVSQFLVSLVKNFYDQCWRTFATVLSFFFFGVGSLLLGLLMLPLFPITVFGGGAAKQRVRAVVGSAMGFFVWIMKTLGVLDYQISGYENIPVNTPVLILANHPSLIDVVFLQSIFPRAQCVVKRALYRNPFTHFTIKNAGYISSSDPQDVLSDSVEAVRSGSSLIVFPEGTRTQAGALPAFKSGAAAVAIRSGCKILPIFIRVRPATLGRSDKWYSAPDKKVKVRIQIGRVFSSDVLSVPAVGQRQQIRALNAYLQKYFIDNLTEYKA